MHACTVAEYIRGDRKRKKIVSINHPIKLPYSSNTKRYDTLEEAEETSQDTQAPHVRGGGSFYFLGVKIFI